MVVAAFYRGVAFPFQRGSDSIPAPAYDANLVRMSVQQIIQTQRGERVMRPNFGSNIHQFVFENNDELLAQLLRTEIAASIGKWEPRVQLTNVSIQRADTSITILVEYAVIATGQTDTVSFPVSTPASPL